MDDRRRCARVRVSLEAQIEGIDPRPVVRRGDLSHTGIFIELDREIGEPGSVVHLCLRSRDREVRLEIGARVARVVRSDDILRGRVVSGIGLEFLAYDQGVRSVLDRFIAHVAGGSTREVASAAEDDLVAVGSLSLETDWQLRKGEEVGIEVPSPAGGHVRYTGRAVRSRRGKTGSFRTRIEVVDAPPEPNVPLGGIRDALIARAVEPRTHLSGDLSRFGLPTLLSLASVEQLTGVLTLKIEGGATQVYLREGRVVDIVGGATVDPIARLTELCRVVNGRFSLVLQAVERPDRLGKTTTAFLIDLARKDDEAKRVA